MSTAKARARAQASERSATPGWLVLAAWLLIIGLPEASAAQATPQPVSGPQAASTLLSAEPIPPPPPPPVRQLPPPLPPLPPSGAPPGGAAGIHHGGAPGAKANTKGGEGSGRGGAGAGAGAGAGVMPVAELLIDLSEQRLSAFDADHRLLYRRLVSTGLPASPTPSGTFKVASRFTTTSLTGRDYHIPSVPNVLCLGGGGLNPDSICIHPAPWQEAAGQPFGVRRSHGCVRTSLSTARWLFERTAVGTPVIIRP